MGVEISPRAADVARRRAGATGSPNLDTAAAAHPGDVDVVTFFQVLEHMTDPLGALISARRCLRDRGTLAIETWDRSSVVARAMGSRWQQVSPPAVVWRFDRSSLVLLLRRAGFHTTALRRTAKRVTVELVGSVLELQQGAFTGLGRALRRSPVRDRSFRYGLGDLVTAVAIPAPRTAAPSKRRDMA